MFFLSATGGRFSAEKWQPGTKELRHQLQFAFFVLDQWVSQPADLNYGMFVLLWTVARPLASS